MGQEGNATSWQVATLYLLHEQEVEIWKMFNSIHSVEFIFSIIILAFLFELGCEVRLVFMGMKDW